MIQRERSLPGLVSECPTRGCGRQPFHIEHGNTLHSMECAHCDIRTTKHPSLQEALQEWEMLPRAEVA